MRYLICKDRKILGPLPPDDLVHLGGFSLSSWVCPEDRTGCQPSHWQKAETAPEIKALIEAPSVATTTLAPESKASPVFQPPITTGGPAKAQDNKEKADELGGLLAAMESRMEALEKAAQAEPPPAVEKTEPKTAPVPAPASAPAELEVDAGRAELEKRLDGLAEALRQSHQAQLEALGELERRNQARLGELAARRFIRWDCGDFKSALGGLLTLATGIAAAAAGLIGLAAKSEHLGPEQCVWALFAAGALIGTGLHQIGAANNQAELLRRRENSAAPPFSRARQDQE